MKSCFDSFQGQVGSGWVGLDDGNTDNKANSAQFQVKLPTGAELGNRYQKVSEPPEQKCQINNIQLYTISFNDEFKGQFVLS